MVDAATALEYAAIAIGFFSTILVLVTQLFGTGGVLDFGWSVRVRTVSRLRSELPEFERLFKRMSSTQAHGVGENALYWSTAFIPVYYSLAVTYLIPRPEQLIVILVLVLVTEVPFWFLSDKVAGWAGQLRTGKLPLTEPQRTRLHRLRFLEGRMVLGSLNPPLYLLSSAFAVLISPPSPGDFQLAIAGVGVAIVLSLLFGRSAIRALMQLEGAVYSDFLSEWQKPVVVRASLRDSAGGHSTVEGSLTGLADQLVIRDEKGFDEWIHWHHISRISIRSSDSTHPSAVPGSQKESP